MLEPRVPLAERGNAEHMSSDIMATTVLYKLYLQNLAGATKPWSGYTAAAIRVMLTTSSYIPSQTHQYKSDVTSEVTGTGYTPGGKVLSGKSLELSGNIIYLKGGNVTWSTMDFTPRYAIVYDDTNALDTDKLLLGYADLGNVKGKSLRLRWASSRVLRITLENAVGFP